MAWIEDLYNQAVQNNGYAQSAEVVYGRGRYDDSRVVSSCTVLLTENYQLWYREVYSENDHAQCGYDLGFEQYYKMYADLFTMPFELGKNPIKRFKGNGKFDFKDLPSEMIEKFGKELKQFEYVSEDFAKWIKDKNDDLDRRILYLKTKSFDYRKQESEKEIALLLKEKSKLKKA